MGLNASREAFAPGEYHFRIRSWFETGAARCVWLDTFIAIGDGERLAPGSPHRVTEIL